MNGNSARRYEALMLALSGRLHAQGKLLTAAVLSGVTAGGSVNYDAAAQTNAVLNAVDCGAILAAVPGDSAGDQLLYNGMEVYYNGVDTFAEKTRYAGEHLNPYLP